MLLGLKRIGLTAPNQLRQININVLTVSISPIVAVIRIRISFAQE